MKKRTKKATAKSRLTVELDGPVKMLLDQYAKEHGRSIRHITQAALNEYLGRVDKGVTA